jgi:Skp family chaperone for outer membrane proteins
MKTHGFMKTFIILASCLLLGGASGLSFAAEVKFGKVNLGEVRKNSAKVKAAVGEVQKTLAEASAKINNLKQETEQLQEKLKSQADSPNKEERQKLETELQDKKQQLQEEMQTVKIKATFQQQSVQNAIKVQMSQAIEKIAKEEGLSAVFLSELLLYSEGITDLTEKVTKAVDSMPPLDLSTR